MVISEVSLGQRVLVIGTVQSISARTGSEPATHSVHLRLSDGQAVQTNVRNITPELVSVESDKQIEEATIQGVRAEGERAADELQTALDDQIQALSVVEQERDEWREKATAAESAAKQIGLELEAIKAELAEVKKSATAALSANPPERLEKPQEEAPATPDGKPAKKGGK